VSAPNHVIRANTLEENIKGSVSERHDVVLTNPPFGGTEGRHIQQNFPVQTNATELLFMEHVIKKLKNTPYARCALVVPRHALSRRRLCRSDEGFARQIPPVRVVTCRREVLPYSM
jgi:type I restriction enzyme M protein